MGSCFRVLPLQAHGSGCYQCRSHLSLRGVNSVKTTFFRKSNQNNIFSLISRKIFKIGRNYAVQCGIAQPSPGEIIESQNDSYRIIRLLGQGSQGCTYEALNRKEKLVALKIVSLKTMRGWKSLDLFEREARVLRSINHVGIPAYIDDFQIDDKEDRFFCLAQNLAIGRSFEDLVESGWRVSESQVREIAYQVLDTLSYLEDLRPPVVHRDIKPGNLVYDEITGTVQLVDFGAVLEQSALPFASGSTVVGTFGYMAPEQFQNRATSVSDLYSLGATLLFLLSGRHPISFSQSQLKIQFESSVKMSSNLKAVIARLLEPAPELRFQSAAEVLNALNGQEVKSSIALLNPSNPTALGRSTQSGESPRPDFTAVAMDEADNSLLVRLPSSGIDGSALFEGSFALAWVSFVAFWTAGAIASRAPIPFTLFSLPFWLAGKDLVSGVVQKSIVNTELFFEGIPLSSGTFRIKAVVFDREIIVAEGFCRDIDGIQARAERTCIEIRHKGKKIEIGQQLSVEERQWVAHKLKIALRVT